MRKKKKRLYNPNNLKDAIAKWPKPIHDKKHGYFIYIEGRARSNQTRVDHIIEYGHDLKVRDLDLVPAGINQYFIYKKDPLYKNTFNYYVKRRGRDKGFIKISIRVDDYDNKKAWIKTIFITYRIK